MKFSSKAPSQELPEAIAECLLMPVYLHCATQQQHSFPLKAIFFLLAEIEQLISSAKYSMLFWWIFKLGIKANLLPANTCGAPYLCSVSFLELLLWWWRCSFRGKWDCSFYMIEKAFLRPVMLHSDPLSPLKEKRQTTASWQNLSATKSYKLPGCQKCQ